MKRGSDAWIACDASKRDEAEDHHESQIGRHDESLKGADKKYD